MPASDDITDQESKESIKDKKRRELKEQLEKSKELGNQNQGFFKSM